MGDSLEVSAVTEEVEAGFMRALFSSPCSKLTGTDRVAPCFVIAEDKRWADGTGGMGCMLVDCFRRKQIDVYKLDFHK